jgi:prolyl oligopeptidase PreP (S9A serine peptidase family)
MALKKIVKIKSVPFFLGNDGGDHWLDKGNKYYVRCVRGGQ